MRRVSVCLEVASTDEVARLPIYKRRVDLHACISGCADEGEEKN